MLVQLRTKDEFWEADVSRHERLLHACLARGLSVPYECASGTCGTCRATLLSGSLKNLWPEAPASKGLARNQFLLCQCAAHTDCEIQVEKGGGSLLHVPRSGLAVVTYVKQVASNIFRFGLELDSLLTFRGGQFIAIQLPGVSGYRNYSIVNYFESVRNVDFVMKKVSGGRFSEWISRTPCPGEQVEWFGPLGMATFDPDCASDLICIAGGTGIAGMMAILAHAMHANYFRRQSGKVFFGVRSLFDSFFLEELSEFVKRSSGRLSVTVALSEPESSVPERDQFPDLNFERGLVHEVAAQGVGKVKNANAYLAGPSPAVDAAIKMLMLRVGLPAKNIRYDRFA